MPKKPMIRKKGWSWGSIIAVLRERQTAYLSRRPHRSFQLTRRRDYARSLKLPGYWQFTVEVLAILWRHKNLFVSLAIVYAVLSAVFVGLSSQDSYDQLADLLSESGSELLGGGWGAIGGASLLLLSGIGGSFAPQLSDVQQVYGMLLLVLIWLTTVWLLRTILSGKQPRLRDGIYNAGSPLVPSALVFLTIIIQLMPLALAIVIVNAAVTTGFISGGILSMLAWLVTGLVALVSLYWIISTIMALVVVTLPGMYPWQAIRTAGDLVIGRRLRLLLRLVWLSFFVGFLWVIFVLPVIVIDNWLRSIWPWFENIPLVPVTILVVTSLASVIMSAYLYLLYRKVVEDDADPA